MIAKCGNCSVLLGRKLVEEELHEGEENMYQTHIRYYEEINNNFEIRREYKKILNPIEKDHFTIFSNGYMACSASKGKNISRNEKYTFENIFDYDNFRDVDPKTFDMEKIISRSYLKSSILSSKYEQNNTPEPKVYWAPIKNTWRHPYPVFVLAFGCKNFFRSSWGYAVHVK